MARFPLILILEIINFIILKINYHRNESFVKWIKKEIWKHAVILNQVDKIYYEDEQLSNKEKNAVQ